MKRINREEIDLGRLRLRPLHAWSQSEPFGLSCPTISLTSLTQLRSLTFLLCHHFKASFLYSRSFSSLFVVFTKSLL